MKICTANSKSSDYTDLIDALEIAIQPFDVEPTQSQKHSIELEFMAEVIKRREMIKQNKDKQKH